MKRVILALLLLFAIGSAANLQADDWLKRLGKRVENRIKRDVEIKTDRMVAGAIDAAEDALVDGVNKSLEKAANRTQQAEEEIYIEDDSAAEDISEAEIDEMLAGYTEAEKEYILTFAEIVGEDGITPRIRRVLDVTGKSLGLTGNRCQELETMLMSE